MTDHFGNPLLEQRKLHAGEAYVERTDCQVISVSGPDVKSWLHSLLSQNILNLNPGDSTEALLLDPQGHVEQQLKVIAREDDLLLIVTREKSEALISWLEKMKFRSKVEILLTDLRVFGSFANLAGDIWIDSFSKENPFSVSYSKNRVEFNYRELVSLHPPDYEQVGLLAYQALRIAAGRPEISDVDEKSLPHEFDWLLSAVHMSKGCYRGQETVAKVHNLGHPPRRLSLLNLESGDDAASKSDQVYYQEKLVGKVVAAALHFELGSIALALLNRNTPYLDLQVDIAGRKVSASQEVLVPADAGKAANLPRPASFKLSGRKP